VSLSYMSKNGTLHSGNYDYMCTVSWDCSQKANYQSLLEGKHNLKAMSGSTGLNHCHCSDYAS